MNEKVEEKNLEVDGFLNKASQYLEKNKKMILTVCGVVVVVALAIWAYIALVAQPRQVRASEDMYAAEQWFGEGDFQKALDGTDEYMGFEEVIDQYGGTKSANLAKYYAGVCQLNLGNYEEAISYLRSYNGRDIFTAAEATMLIGDAYAEMDNASEAAKYYAKAAKQSDNFVTAPVALWKEGMMYLKLGDKSAAKKAFQKIKDNYPESPEWSQVDKFIAYAGE